MEKMDDAVAALNAALEGSTDEVGLAMGRVKEYLRHVKGKTVRVKGYTRRINGADLITGDLVKDAFGRKKSVDNVGKDHSGKPKVWFSDGTSAPGDHDFEVVETPPHNDVIRARRATPSPHLNALTSADLGSARERSPEVSRAWDAAMSNPNNDTLRALQTELLSAQVKFHNKNPELSAAFRKAADDLKVKISEANKEQDRIASNASRQELKAKNAGVKLSVDEAEDAMIVALAGFTDVKSYTRRTKTGKSVHVSSYKRKVLGKDLKVGDLVTNTFGKQDRVASVNSQKVTFASGKEAPLTASFNKIEEPSTDKLAGRTTSRVDAIRQQHGDTPEAVAAMRAEAKTTSVKAVADSLKSEADKLDARLQQSGTNNPTAARALAGRKSSGYDQARLQAAGNPGATGSKMPEVKAGGAKAPLSDEEYQKHTQHIEEEIGKALSEGKATDKQYAVDANSGVWDFDRAQRHREIADAMWKARAESVPNEGKAMISGGLGGAGKSTVLKIIPGADEKNYFTINSDDVKEHIAQNFPDMIPEAGDLSPLERVALIHEESSHIADILAARAYAEKKNMIWDITMASQKSVQKRLNDLRANGYTDVKGVFVNIDVETSVSRALARHRRGMEDYRNGKGKGGRYVPPHIIRLNKSDKSSSANLDTFTALKDQFDSWDQYNNNVNGRAPQKEGSSTGSGSAASSVAADPFVNRTNL